MAENTFHSLLTQEARLLTSDRRVKYTISALEDALLELMADKPIERISVKELCEKADVNRSTFYAHYGSPQELFNSVIEAVVSEFSSIKDRNMTIDEVIRESITLLKARGKLFMALNNTRDGILGFMARALYVWEDTFIESMAASGVNDDTAKAMYSFIAAGSASVIGVQTVGGVKVSIEDTISEIRKMIDAIINAYTRRQ